MRISIGIKSSHPVESNGYNFFLYRQNYLHRLKSQRLILKSVYVRLRVKALADTNY